MLNLNIKVKSSVLFLLVSGVFSMKRSSLADSGLVSLTASQKLQNSNTNTDKNKNVFNTLRVVIFPLLILVFLFERLIPSSDK